MDLLNPSVKSEASFVSTGHLPAAEDVKRLVVDAHERFRSVDQGQVSQVYPALARVPSDLFGICVVVHDGNVYPVGDAEHEFSIMSVSKPFVFALVCELSAPTRPARGSASTRPAAVQFACRHRAQARRAHQPDGERRARSRRRAWCRARTREAKWQFIHEGLSRFAGRTLPLNEEVYASASETNFRNRSIARMLESFGRIYCDPAEATDLYTRQCSLNVSAKDLAVMGATLADGGVNPITGSRWSSPTVCHYALAVMATAGLYETSGDWLYEIGLPGKSGIGGGIVTVSPGKGGLGTFAPPLDEAGNSVKGQLVAQFLSQRLGLDLLVSVPQT